MTALFFISLILLFAAVISRSFYKKNPRLQMWILALLSGLTIFSFFAMVFTRFLATHVEFARPYALLLLVIPFAIAVAASLYKETFNRRINFPLAHLQPEQTSLRVLFTDWLPQFIYLLSLCLLIVALARPMRVERTILPPTEGVDIMLLMDASASMQKQDFLPNRFIAAQETAKRFVAKRPSDRIGLVVFANQAMLQVPLTLDHEALQEYISAMFLGMVDPHWTAIGDGLGVAVNHLKDSKAKSKVIILLTDGDSNAGSVTPVMAAKAAQSYNIRVYTIGTASAPGQTAFSSDEEEINEGLLMEIADLTGGKFYRAKNERELEQIYEKINELETTVFTPSSSIHRTDVYFPLLLWALCGILAGFFLEKLIFIKVP